MAYGGKLVADVLRNQRVEFLFTLCGGHISPIFIEAKRAGLRVIDTRDEKNAVFAADAVARLSGTPGVAAVTAGPGVTNALTALKNAQMAQSPVVLLGGATATFLKGRGSLQDIDQLAVVKPHVKWAATCKTVRELVPTLEQAFQRAVDGVPGPVFVELPVDLLYDEALVRQWYGDAKTKGRGLVEKGINTYLDYHVNRLFSGGDPKAVGPAAQRPHVTPSAGQVRRAALMLAQARRPVLLAGSQAMLCACEAFAMDHAVETLQIPVYLSGMARGLLGRNHPLQLFHKRREALKEADLVILAGVPNDFRLDYGRHISRQAKVVAANFDRAEMNRNRRPTLGVQADPGLFLIALADEVSRTRHDHARAWRDWARTLRERNDARQADIEKRAADPVPGINPLHLAMEIDKAMDDDSVIVVDGGDFVASASYVMRPRGPFRWLDPGVFGTLGVGGGFALGAKLRRPEAEVWLMYGDGSAAYSVAEFDTFVRHDTPVIAVVGNDACWSQIAREQVEIYGDSLACDLRRSDYHLVAEGYGGKGLLLSDPQDIPRVLAEAKRIAKSGTPVLINAHIGATDFRKGSISM
ncbi:MAG: thiamine pyrophosphate-binding protein [Candidatus Lernaella stagnicola]|nr:thiamine pyrophosphate-binding protein [Candidatus Lernaella stagnicola]